MRHTETVKSTRFIINTDMNKILLSMYFFVYTCTYILVCSVKGRSNVLYLKFLALFHFLFEFPPWLQPAHSA